MIVRRTNIWSRASAAFPIKETFAAMIEAAGLARVRCRNMTGGIAALHSAWRV